MFSCASCGDDSYGEASKLHVLRDGMADDDSDDYAECPVCLEPADYCQGGHETDEYGYLVISGSEASERFADMLDELLPDRDARGCRVRLRKVWQRTHPIAYSLARDE